MFIGGRASPQKAPVAIGHGDRGLIPHQRVDLGEGRRSGEPLSKGMGEDAGDRKIVQEDQEQRQCCCRMWPYQVQDGSAHAAAAPPNGVMNARPTQRLGGIEINDKLELAELPRTRVFVAITAIGRPIRSVASAANRSV
jgi:hypothetical protein